MSSTIFIGDIPSQCSVLDIVRVFLPFGEIFDVRITTNPKSGQSMHYGFVEFKNGDSAQKALSSLNGEPLFGISMRLSFAKKRKPLSSPTLVRKDCQSSIHVAFTLFNAEAFVTEEILNDMFTPFGGAFDVAIIKQAFYCKQSGYGFINFDCVSDAEQALSGVGITVKDGVQYVCSLSVKQSHQSTTSPSSVQSGTTTLSRTDSADSFDQSQCSFDQTHFSYNQHVSPPPPPLMCSVEYPHNNANNSNNQQYNPPSGVDKAHYDCELPQHGRVPYNIHIPQYPTMSPMEQQYQAQLYMQQYNANLQHCYMQYQPHPQQQQQQQQQYEVYCNQWNRPAAGQHFKLPPPRSLAAQQHVQLMYGVSLPVSPQPVLFQSHYSQPSSPTNSQSHNDEMYPINNRRYSFPR